MALKSSTAFRAASCRLTDCFATDPRPTIIIEVLPTSDNRGVHLEFANNAFTQQYGVLLRFIISGQILEPDFIRWLKSPDPASNEYRLGDLCWTFFILQRRWKVLSVASARSTVQQPVANYSPAQSSLVEPLTDDSTPPSSRNSSDDTNKQNEPASGLVVASPTGLVSLGSASTALEGLHRSVDMLDVGFFEYDLEGTLIYANKSWYALSGHPTTPQAHTEKRFLDLCHPDDIENVTKAWMGLVQGKPVTFEMRWRHMGTPTAQSLGAQWVLAACLPLYDDHGQLKSISGCTTDINNQKLSQQIAHSRAEALERARTFEERFVKFASVAPIVIFSFDANKKMTYCNDRWFEVTTTSKKPFDDIELGEGLRQEDVVKLYTLVDEAVRTREVTSVEMRVKRAWTASDGRKAQAWVLASIFAEFTNDDIFRGCTGTLTDISEFKYAETLQRHRLEDALEAKRTQENFIDMTSHEIRNPLSAMVQCADSAICALEQIRSLIAGNPAVNDDQFLQGQPLLRAQLDEDTNLALESLQTIVSCCAHQKCIVDDVLTLSKLDSKILGITPVKVEPSRVLREVAKMFEKDAATADVELTTAVDNSIEKYGVQWLMFDPSRVKQILINLVSNAIKFTRTQSVRKVEMRMCASIEAPSASSGGRVKYAPTSRSVPDNLLVEREWGSGDIVYLQFSLQDTGRGLNEKEKERLFHRFSQASPKTHVEYGGSGLGLFITKQLAELQGGEIGVSSVKDEGSTFAFYIQTRKTSPPERGSFPLSPRLTTSQTQDNMSPSLAASAALSPISSLTADLPDDSARKASLREVTIPTPSEKIRPSLVDRRPNVLIVEDNMVNQKVLSTQLKRLGCNVFVANHGVEALDFLKTTQLWHGEVTDKVPRNDLVDIVLMDIEMPVMGGLACTRAIRELEKQGLIAMPQERSHHYQLPIISISANAREEQGNAQREAGVDDIVTKPFRIPQLMEKIWKLVGRGTQLSSSFIADNMAKRKYKSPIPTPPG